MPHPSPLPPSDETSDRDAAYALEERLRTDPEFREACLFWAQFYTELARHEADVSPLVRAFVEGLFEETSF
ncbi:MAG: hypothetical protein GVY12_13965 [Bacteroidetes bacterium]|jgi:hypothetical protein|nr:hypothetical protein [Bacteroidota bacterium]